MERISNTPIKRFSLFNGFLMCSSFFLSLKRRYVSPVLDVNALDSSGRTPLHNAILGRHVKIIQLLLESDADTSLLDRSQDAPLHGAVRSGHEDLVRVHVMIH